MDQDFFDVIIVGAGPAGLTAGLYASRRMLKTLIITKDVGGQAALTTDVENYPGQELVDGIFLIQSMAKQAEKFGCLIKPGIVAGIKKQDDYFIVKTETEEYQAKAVILAFGLLPKDLDIPGELEFKGKGVSYCATCDGPLFRNKIVAVVGGGNAALDAAEYLSRLAAKVYLVHRRDQFRGEEAVVERLKNHDKVEFVLSSQIIEIKGEQFVSSILLQQTGKDKTLEIPVNGVFVEIGYVAKTEIVKDLVKLNDKGEIITDKDTQTSHEGIFACGDVTDTSYKQIVISAGEGAKAALQTYKYLCLQSGQKILPDWEIMK